MPPRFTVTVTHGGIGKLPGTRLRPGICDGAKDESLYMGVELRNQRPPTLVLAFYQHGLEIHQFFHPPFSEEKNERTFSSPACWSVRPTVCSPKEGDVRVSHPYACSWVRTSILAFCHSFTNLSPRVDVDLDIPAIAAIGWQSAGKSSLIEAISGIKLPRASGTCTR